MAGTGQSTPYGCSAQARVQTRDVAGATRPRSPQSVRGSTNSAGAGMGRWPGTSGRSRPIRPSVVVNQSSEVRLMSSETDIRPFRVDMPDEAIADLRRRIAATRWPSRELVADRSQGVQLATIQELARYWAAEYDWRACQARLNALPQFTTEIGGVDIHHRLRPAGFTRRPGGLAARPRHRRLLQDLPRLPRRAALRRPEPGQHHRQHHAVLADRHRDLGSPGVLGDRTSRSPCSRAGSSGGQAPGRLRHVPR
jgi:Epoxide hydrolase N terminus